MGALAHTRVFALALGITRAVVIGWLGAALALFLICWAVDVVYRAWSER